MSDAQPGSKVIFSFDFEIGWGDIVYPDVWRRRESKGVYKRLRTVLPEILREMDAMELPATWASVGAMFETPTKRSLDHLPSDAATLVNDALRSGEPESFDGRDLFEMVISTQVHHDIACHSYSHIPFTYAGMDEICVQADLKAFKRALGEYNMKTDRFVFPENLENAYEALRREGFEKIRVAPDHFFSNRWLYLASIAVTPPPRSREEPAPSGLVQHFGSMLFADATQTWRVPLVMRRVALGLKSVRKSNGVLHIWSHPFNFAESEPLKVGFLKVLRKIADERDRGNLVVEPM